MTIYLTKKLPLHRNKSQGTHFFITKQGLFCVIIFKKRMKNNLIIVCICAMMAGCTTRPAPPTTTLNILCSTGMIADAAQNIAKNKATITALMGAGTDPHLYKATQGDLVKMRQADIIFYNGLHLEGKMITVFEALKRTKTTVALGETLPKNLLIPNDKFGSNYDPHIWFSIKNWQAIARNITATLQQKDTTNAVFYQKNLAVYLSKLDSLDTEIRLELQKIPTNKRILITSHDAFEYFGKEYGVQVRALQGVSTVAEYGIKDVTDLVNFVVLNQIKSVFIESSVSPRSIEAVVQGCQQKKHTVRIGGTLYSDAMGAAHTPEGTYVGMLRHNARAIAQGLE
jgi:manganese/zinc/iron transport system substrate-binding protein